MPGASPAPPSDAAFTSSHAVAEAYGVWGKKSMYGRSYMGIVRSSFLIDEKGKILEAWYQVSPKDTVPKALRALVLRTPTG